MDWIASALTFVGLFLNGRKNIACWPVWIVGDVLWLVYGVGRGEWAIVLLNASFLALNSFGWYQWLRRPQQ